MAVIHLLLSISLASLCFSSAMSIPTKVGVIGSTGRLGREAVQQLSDRGIRCKLLLRRPITATAPQELTAESTKDEIAAYLASLKKVEIMQGDISSVESLKEFLADCSACLALHGATRRSKISDMWSNAEDSDPSHAKQVNYKAIGNIIEAAKASKGCKRIVRITGKGEDPSGIFSILINLLGSMAKAWNYQGELLLRDEKDVDYTIIRPGIMSEDGPEGKVLTLADDGADLPVAKIRYANIANLCIECLSYSNAARTTLTAMTTEDGTGEETYAPLLKTVAEDRRQFPRDMFQQHQAAVRKAVLGLSTFAVVFLSILVRMILTKLFS